jgi:hypothetical protein
MADLRSILSNKEYSRARIAKRAVLAVVRSRLSASAPLGSASRAKRTKRRNAPHAALPSD